MHSSSAIAAATPDTMQAHASSCADMQLLGNFGLSRHSILISWWDCSDIDLLYVTCVVGPTVIQLGRICDLWFQ
jgi:hypothetical protein